MKTWIWFTLFCLPALAATPDRITLTEIDAGGRTIESGTKYELFVTQDNRGNLTGFELSETGPTECNTTGCRSSARIEKYEINASHADSCGDVSYLATSCANPKGQIEVMDHTAQRCGWSRAYHWEAAVNDGDTIRRFIGK